MLANKSFDIQLISFADVEKKLPDGMAMSCTTRSIAVRLDVTGIMTAEICKSLYLMVDQAIAAPIRQPRTKITCLNFATPYKAITKSMPTYQKSAFGSPSCPCLALPQSYRSLKSTILRTSPPRHYKIDNRWWTSSS